MASASVGGQVFGECMEQTSVPSMWVTREVLKQLRTVPIVDIDSTLDWLYEV